ncbi:phospholipase D family protein [Paracoccus sp. SSK6]|uniref:phospholipase D family protein n=1 Tax=Paracoccus sp. SSK6 TaxID=3143131 RepID=UPI003218ECE6
MADFLLENGEHEDHASLLGRYLERAERFICIVAFAKMSGLKLIHKALEARVAGGMSATFVIGIDFFQSEPKLLRKLLHLRTSASKVGGEVKVYMGCDASPHTMHPKVYWIKGGKEEVLIVGSANMTFGGFSDNHEISAALSGAGRKWRRRLEDWVGERITSGDVVEATPALINAYEKRRNIYSAAMKAAEWRARRSMELPAGQTIILSDLLAEMRADDGPEGFAAQVKQRRSSHREAVALLAGLADDPDLKPRDFLPRYEEQIAQWHSGGLHRGKTALAKKAPLYQAALRAVAAERTQDPAALFDLLKSYFDKIPRAGINVLTEILHTRDPKQFPVMNQNSVAGMGLANFAGYPHAPAKTNVNGECYRSFAADAAALRQSLGLHDFTELDVLFNFAYWNPPKAHDVDEAQKALR